MIDFWELMGRMLTDQNFLNAVLGYRATPAFTPAVANPMNQRIAIPQADYDNMRTIVCGARAPMQGKPVSLMALGEILYVLTKPNFASRARAACAALNGLLAPQVTQQAPFYQALGAMTLDGSLRAEMADGGRFAQNGFGNVDQADQTNLSNYLRTGSGGEQAITALCGAGWQNDCNDKMLFWANHTHPITP